MRSIWIFMFLAILLLNIEFCFGAPKRTFGLGRNRPKSNGNSSIRRRAHYEQPKIKPDRVIKSSGGVMNTMKKN